MIEPVTDIEDPCGQCGSEDSFLLVLLNKFHKGNLYASRENYDFLTLHLCK